MSKFDRSQFDATDQEVLKHEDDKVDKLTKFEGYYHKIEQGENVFRIYPKHPGMKSYIITRIVYWLPTEVEDNNKTEWKRKAYPDARQHGGFKKDLVEEYKSMLRLWVKTEPFTSSDDGKAEAIRLIAAINAYPNGLKHKTTRVCYASKLSASGWSDVKLLEFGNSVYGQFGKLSLTRKSKKVDPFTHPDTGRPVLIDYDSNEDDNKERYKVNKEDDPVKLSDDELDLFMQKDSLEMLYGKSIYTKEDFDIMYKGLEHFDDINEIGLFEIDDWINADWSEFYSAFGELDTTTGEIVEKEEKPKEKFGETAEVVEETKAVDVVEEVAEELIPEELIPELDPFGEMDRHRLKVYIRDNSLKVQVFKTHTDDQIRANIRAVVNKEPEVDIESMRASLKKK
jgi:hypothetical protein